MVIMTQVAWPRVCHEECSSSLDATRNGQAQQVDLTASLRCDLEYTGAKEVSHWRLWREEACKVVHLALPLSITNLSGFALGLVTVAFVGRLGQHELSVAVLATSIFNVTGLSVLVGFAAAMETFCGQAYGAGSYLMVGVVLQRALILTSLLVMSMAALWSQAGLLLETLGQDPGIARGSARYLRLALPALYFTGIFEVLKRYLMVQGAVRPATIVTLGALALSPLYNWLMIFHMGLGLDGAVLAVNAVQATLVLGLGSFVMVREFCMRASPARTWGGWSWQAFRGWSAYLTYALPSVAMICCEWWTFEAVIIMAGWLAEPDLSVAVMGIAINISGVVYMLVTGLSMSCSVRVSTSLGAGRPHAARSATMAALLLTTCLEAAAAAAVITGRRHVPLLFTDIPAVVHLTQELLPVFALSLPGDGVNAVLQGLLRGAGKQRLGAITNVTSYWFFGIPLAAYCAFKLQYGVYGLWYGLVAVNTVQGLVMLVVALRFDYDQQAERAGRLFGPTSPSPQSTVTQPLLEAGVEGRLPTESCSEQQLAPEVISVQEGQQHEK